MGSQRPQLEYTEEATHSLRRDWRAENANAAVSHAGAIAEIRQLRDRGEFYEFCQTAQAIILCVLPYKPTKLRQITKKARLGNGSTLIVTFLAALDGVEMPYGTDRTVLHWIFDRAVKENTRFISWRTAQEFISDMGLSKSGKNNKDLRERVRRVKGLAISVQRTSKDTDTSLVLPIIRRSCLPASVGDVKKGHKEDPSLPDDETQLGVELDPDFFEELKRFHVKIPKELVTSTRRSSQLQDCVLFLYWRSFAALEESLIRWDILRLQLWHEDKTRRRIKGRFKTAIKWLKLIWPELQAEAKADGLWIAPPVDGRHFIPGTTKKIPERTK